MPRTPIEQAFYDAERPIYTAAAALDKALLQLATLRSGLAAIRVPIPKAEDRLDHSDDLLATVAAMINRAANDLNDEIERLQEAEEVRYVRDHGLSALDDMEEAA